MKRRSVVMARLMRRRARLENRKRRRSGRVPAVGATALAAMYQRRREADTFGGALLALLGRAAIETEREGWGQR